MEGAAGDPLARLVVEGEADDRAGARGRPRSAHQHGAVPDRHGGAEAAAAGPLGVGGRDLGGGIKAPLGDEAAGRLVHCKDVHHGGSPAPGGGGRDGDGAVGG